MKHNIEKIRKELLLTHKLLGTDLSQKSMVFSGLFSFSAQVGPQGIGWPGTMSNTNPNSSDSNNNPYDFQVFVDWLTTKILFNPFKYDIDEIFLKEFQRIDKTITLCEIKEIISKLPTKSNSTITIS